jgi:hypothetical protein
MNAKMGAHSRVLVVFQIKAEDILLSTLIVVQITGKARGGGAHQGRRRSLNCGSSAEAEGLLLSRGLNTRLRRLKTQNNPATKTVGRFEGKAFEVTCF